MCFVCSCVWNNRLAFVANLKWIFVCRIIIIGEANGIYQRYNARSPAACVGFTVYSIGCVDANELIWEYTDTFSILASIKICPFDKLIKYGANELNTNLITSCYLSHSVLMMTLNERPTIHLLLFHQCESSHRFSFWCGLLKFEQTAPYKSSRHCSGFRSMLIYPSHIFVFRYNSSKCQQFSANLIIYL